MKFGTLVKLFGGLVAIYIVLCTAATISIGKPKPIESTFDWRIQGVSSSGWAQPRFSFLEERIYFFGTELQLIFETVRPQESGPAEITFQFGKKEKREIQITRDPIYFRSSTLSAISIDGQCKNPFEGKGDSGNQLCAKISSIGLKPRFGFFFLDLSFIAPILFLTAALSLAFSYLLKKRFFTFYSILPVGIVSVLLAASPFDHWDRSYWMFGFFILIVSGYCLAERYFEKTKESEESNKNTFYPFLAVVIFVFALWLRISVVQFGIPHLYHPDESRKIRVAGQIVQTGDLNPNYFRHPSFIPYSTALLGKIKSLYSGHSPKYSELLYYGRSVSATLGAATILVVYALAAFLYSQQIGLVAAALLAVAPLHVVCSRYLKEDADLLFFLMLSIYFVCRYIKIPRTSLLVIAGLFGGIASSVKYSGALSGAFLLLPFSLLVLQKKFKEASSIIVPTAIAGLCVIVAFLAITPYSVLNFPKFWKDLYYEGEHMARGHTGAISAGAYFWTFHLSQSIIPALTTPVSILALISLGFLLYRRRAEDLFIVFTVLIFYLPAEYVKAKPFPQPERYILPCIPFLCIALSTFLFELKKANKLFSFLPLLLLVFPGWYSIAHRNVILNDTRAQATNWVSEHIPAKSSIVSDWTFYSPYLPRDKYNVIELKAPQGRDILSSLSLQTLQRANVDYFITSSLFYDRYLRQVKRGYKSSLGFQEIFEKAPRMATFSNPRFAYGFHNPTVVIFKVPKETK